ncbi:MAG: AhpC/TSA family protein [Flammeovirgaceae bacterium]|nr:AhpC/TSA family protein [Flammeovirgaceae bacterium]
MKKLITIFALFFLITSAKAQLPEKAEDISPLLIGEKIPSASISTIDGKMIASTELFNGQKTILIFYRGGWCPYCNTQLGQLQSIEGDLIKMGYQIVAVSPDTPEKLRESLEKNKLTYTLLADNSGSLAKAMGIAFKAPANYEKRLKAIQGEEAELHLPVPSVFIVGKEGDILFEYINPNYKVRISSNLLLTAAAAVGN